MGPGEWRREADGFGCLECQGHNKGKLVSDWPWWRQRKGGQGGARGFRP